MPDGYVIFLSLYIICPWMALVVWIALALQDIARSKTVLTPL